MTYALCARFRDRDTDVPSVLERWKHALSVFSGATLREATGSADIALEVAHPTTVANLTMALIANEQWVVGIGLAPMPDDAIDCAAAAIFSAPKKAQVRVVIAGGVGGSFATDIESVFELIHYVLSRRSLQGRESTSLMRSGLTQSEAAAQLGISKQAMSQRLRAAGWGAETAGYQLAASLIRRAHDACYASL